MYLMREETMAKSKDRSGREKKKPKKGSSGSKKGSKK
jgi:hypothetical protein